MSPEAQRIAIAEACGWCVEHRDDGQIKWTVLISPEGKRVDSTSGTATLANFGCIPDYLDDLNAMHEAEMSLPADSDDGIDRHSFRTALRAICLDSGNDAMHAIAAQRAVAFLHTIGKWDDAK